MITFYPSGTVTVRYCKFHDIYRTKLFKNITKFEISQYDGPSWVKLDHWSVVWCFMYNFHRKVRSRSCVILRSVASGVSTHWQNSRMVPFNQEQLCKIRCPLLYCIYHILHFDGSHTIILLSLIHISEPTRPY